MYTVDRIEEDLVVLEDRVSKELKNVNILQFYDTIKENDIVRYDDVNKVYKICKEETKNIKNDIRKRFNRIKK